jgi:hypothetical protein
MASMPERANACRRTIQGILEQNHAAFKLWVSLNCYNNVPKNWPKDERVIYRLSDNELGDAEKFYPFGEEGSNLLFTIDDDILYPKNSLSTMLQWFNHFNGKHALGVHGSILAHGFQSWLYDRWVSHFAAPQKRNAQMHVLGTGTTLFDKEWLQGYNFAEWRNISDIGISLHLRCQGIARLTVKRPKKWLRPINRIAPVCYSPKNLQRVADKLKPHLGSFRTEVPCTAGVEQMKAAIRHLPRKRKSGGAVAPIHDLNLPSGPRPINSKPRSRIAVINAQKPTAPKPRRKRI